MKKISLKKKGAALFSAAMIASSGVAMMPFAVPNAIADDGHVTITSTFDSSNTYSAYRLFKADFTAGVADNVLWESNAVRDSIITFLNQSTNGASQTYDEWIAASGYMDGASVTASDRQLEENAVGYITAMFKAGNNNTDTTKLTHVTGDSFAKKLADYVKSNDLGKIDGDITSGTEYTNDQGWYLFVNKNVTEETFGTDAIWFPLGGTDTTITNKTSSLLTFDKTVKETSETNYTQHTDAGRGETLDYKLSYTLPGIFTDYSTYYLKFSDTLEAGKLTLLPGTENADIIVKIDGTVITSGYTLTADPSAGTLVVEFEDVKSNNVKDSENNTVTAQAGDIVTVEYKAQVTNVSNVANSAANSSNTNAAEVEFSNDPMGTSKGKRTDLSKVYNYQLNLSKVDKDDNTLTLKGAKFTLQEKGTTVTRAAWDDWGDGQAVIQATFIRDYNKMVTNGHGSDYGLTELAADTTAAEAEQAYAAFEQAQADNPGWNYAGYPNVPVIIYSDYVISETVNIPGKYVQSDGTLGDTAYEFTTDTNGSISIAGIDAGEYILKETAAPNTYSIPAAAQTGLPITIESVIGNSTLTSVSASTTASSDVATMANDSTSHIMTMTIKDPKANVVFAITGGAGPVVLGGAILLVGGAVLLVVSRRNSKKEGEQE